MTHRLLQRGLATAAGPLKRTHLNSLHVLHSGKMVEFAGWEMPLQYDDLSVIDSHLHTRKHTSLFDVSHMLQFKLKGNDRVAFIERVSVADVQALKPGSATLSLFTNAKGGIIDDTVISKYDDHLYVVSNAGCADKDLQHLREQVSLFKSQGKDVTLEVVDTHSLLALQGPEAVKTLSALTETTVNKLPFMNGVKATLKTSKGNVETLVTRCGYTGEDGFEISVPHHYATPLAETLLRRPNVRLAGLGARDSLRLEAGLCLYGNDIDEDTLPVEASLAWVISERRRKEGGFIGADKVLAQLRDKSETRRRVGFTVEGAPARHGYPIFSLEGPQIGVVTSGGPSPSLALKNIGMAYIDKKHAKLGTPIRVQVRKNKWDGVIAKMPFVPHQYYKSRAEE